jgi:hypothetical protein
MIFMARSFISIVPLAFFSLNVIFTPCFLESAKKGELKCLIEFGGFYLLLLEFFSSLASKNFNLNGVKSLTILCSNIFKGYFKILSG